jgi:hypothetical protein
LEFGERVPVRNAVAGPRNYWRATPFGCGAGLAAKRSRVVDRQTKHEITVVTLAILAPIPLITAAVVAILVY